MRRKTDPSPVTLPKTANVLGLTLADAVEMELHCEAHAKISLQCEDRT